MNHLPDAWTKPDFLRMALGGGLALLALTSAHAYTPTIYYQGSASAQDNGPGHAPLDLEGDTTLAPATYTASSGGNTSSSTSSNAHGGSVHSTASGITELKSDGYLWASGAGAQTSIIYNPYLIGTSGPTRPPIPVRVQASGYVDGSLFGQAIASFNITYFNGGSSPVRLSERAQINANGSGVRTFSIDEIIYILPSTEINIVISANASAVGPDGRPGSSWATAFVDPIFTIDPAYAADYKFVGLPLASSVPEPAVLALLLPGLLTIVVARKRTATC